MSNLSESKGAKNILITGGAGFIGSNFVPYFLEKYPHYNLIILDALTYAGSLENLAECEKFAPRFTFIKGDICDFALVESIFKTHAINAVIHFAAESHVDNSIKNPSIFTKTNILGTQILLDVAKSAWLDEPFAYKAEFKNARFHHISTDEVYGSLGEVGAFSETTPYAPNSPYSASKAGSDMLVRAYHHTFGLDTIITNCSNNYGPKQHDEKLIPTIIRNALSGAKIPIYGDGANVRDWLFVSDHCLGVDLAFHSGRAGESYNIGSYNEKTNLQIANKICTILDELVPKNGSYAKQIEFVKDRAGHDKRYAIDATKITHELGFAPKYSFEQGIVECVKWYVKKYTSHI